MGYPPQAVSPQYMYIHVTLNGLTPVYVTIIIKEGMNSLGSYGDMGGAGEEKGRGRNEVNTVLTCEILKKNKYRDETDRTETKVGKTRYIHGSATIYRS